MVNSAVIKCVYQEKLDATYVRRLEQTHCELDIRCGGGRTVLLGFLVLHGAFIEGRTLDGAYVKRMELTHRELDIRCAEIDVECYLFPPLFVVVVTLLHAYAIDHLAKDGRWHVRQAPRARQCGGQCSMFDSALEISALEIRCAGERAMPLALLRCTGRSMEATSSSLNGQCLKPALLERGIYALLANTVSSAVPAPQ